MASGQILIRDLEVRGFPFFIGNIQEFECGYSSTKVARKVVRELVHEDKIRVKVVSGGLVYNLTKRDDQLDLR